MTNQHLTVAVASRAAMLGIALGVLVPACERGPQASPEQATPAQAVAANPVATTQAASPLKPDDFAVLDAVLAHLAADPEAPTSPILEKNKGIALHRATAGASGFLGNDQLHGEFHREPQKPPADALADLQARNNGIPPTKFDGTNPATDRLPTALDAFKPATPGVILFNFDDVPGRYMPERYVALMKAHPQARCFVTTWLPGYSADGRTAVLRISVGPTAHGATGTYLLRKDDAGKWTVAWRKFSIYA